MREHEWLLGEPTAEEWEELLRPEPAAAQRQKGVGRKTKPSKPTPPPANDDGYPSSRVAGR